MLLLKLKSIKAVIVEINKNEVKYELTDKKITYLFSIPLLLMCLQSVQAQPIMIPGFMAIESSSMDAPSMGSDTSNVYFTISNLHYEPIVLLSASGDIFEGATFVDSNNGELEQVVIEAGNRIVMGPNNVHLRLSGVDVDAEDRYQDITLLVRRGLEAEEEVEAIEALGNMSGVRSREAGIPNEKEYVVNVPVNH